jgi:hypothetical protein
VGCKTVRAYTGTTLVIGFVLETAGNHPPAYNALEATETEHHEQPVTEFGGDGAAVCEECQREHEEIAEQYPCFAVNELYFVYGFEVLK